MTTTEKKMTVWDLAAAHGERMRVWDLTPAHEGRTVTVNLDGTTITGRLVWSKDPHWAAHGHDRWHWFLTAEMEVGPFKGRDVLVSLQFSGPDEVILH